MNCDPLARWYRWLEYGGFGFALEQRRRAFLDGLGDARKVLMLGEGDGRFLAEFLRTNPTAEVDYVDGSRQMLTLAQRRATAAGGEVRVRFHQADALDWLQTNPPGEYDLICTHFFLDCFFTAQVDALAVEIDHHAATNSRWVVSEFRCPPEGWQAWMAKGYIFLLYCFFGVFTGLRPRQLPDYHRALRAVGFRLVTQRFAALDLLVSERWERTETLILEEAPSTSFCV